MQRRNLHQQQYATTAALLAYALATPLLLLTACTSPHTPDSTTPNSTTPGPTSPALPGQSAEARTERKLTAQVESALKAFSDEGSSMAESGVERVSDGIHTQPTLTPGASYAAPKSPVPCDGSAVVERLTAPKAQEPLRLDVRAKPGATGMLAWQINTVAR